MASDIWFTDWRVWTGIVLLTGCADGLIRQAPDVPTIVVQPCVTEVPAIPPTAMPAPGSNVERLAAGASADTRNLALYAERARSLLAACAQQPKEKP